MEGELTVEEKASVEGGGGELKEALGEEKGKRKVERGE